MKTLDVNYFKCETDTVGRIDDWSPLVDMVDGVVAEVGGSWAPCGREQYIHYNPIPARINNTEYPFTEVRFFDGSFGRSLIVTVTGFQHVPEGDDPTNDHNVCFVVWLSKVVVVAD